MLHESSSEVEVAIRYILLTYRSLADFKCTPHLAGRVVVVIFLPSNPIAGVPPSRTLDTRGTASSRDSASRRRGNRMTVLLGGE